MTTPSQIDQTLRLICSKSRPDLTDDRLRFLPRDELFKAFSADVVLKLLESRPESPEEGQPDFAELVDRISPAPNGCRCRTFYCTGARIIFAALLSLSKPELIGVIFRKPDKGICDATLPPKSWPTDGSNLLLEALDNILTPGELGRFLHFTWQMRAPFMQDLASQKEEAVGRQVLEYSENTSLPWTFLSDDKVVDEDGTVDTERTTVHKIIIHPAHRGEDKLDGDLALKMSDDYQAERRYKREVKANLRIPRHDHIVPLLAAFKHRGKFHLILPWARGGNLADLFQNYPNPSMTAEDSQRTADWCTKEWLLAECWGLAEGLAVVHQTPASRQIHADIKPENILCFAPSGQDTGPFTLKLADFGEARQVQQADGAISVKGVPHTKTYRPPEHDTDEVLSLNYDVWCLGCVFLEFITWAIDGSKLLKRFEDARLQEMDDRKASTAKGTVLQDTFFKKTSASWRPRILPQIKLGHYSETIEDKELARRDYRRQHRWSLEFAGSTRVKTLRKKAIQEHITLLQKKCEGNRLHTFLDFIGSRMLVVDPTQRAQSSDVCRFLSGMR